ncbi:MAG TPA: LPS assembly lipoprotein LptE [Xanthobacteraceae bacterium]|jgi:LPS-assembly lipoprotein|nr:LPS assembly lipoprotein LptE [Xanthobacteraceae bacterium]
MSWCNGKNVSGVIRLALVLGLAGLTAGCFEPLYGSRPAINAESVHDKLAEVDIPAIPAREGTPMSRLAVGMRNALQFDLNGGSGAVSPNYRLVALLNSAGQTTVMVDITSGRPTAQIDGVRVTYQLVEIATGKIVLKDSAYARVDTDAPGSQQRFAQQRALRDAEDRAIQLAAEAIRNRLASYFIAGT